MNSRMFLIAATAAVAGLCGCRGCGEQVSPAPTPVPATATVASVATPEEAEAEEETPAPKDHIIAVLAQADPDTGPAPLSVKFTALDPLQNIEGPQYKWDFGDGSPPSDKANPTHVYEHPGHYTARLTVTDATGVSDDDTTDIDVTEPAAAQAPQAGAPPPQ